MSAATLRNFAVILLPISAMSDDNSVGDGPALPKRQLARDVRLAVFNALLVESIDGHLPHGAFTKVGVEFNVDRKTISRIWQRGCKSLDDGALLPEVSKRHRGRQKKHVDVAARVEAVPISRRGTIRSLSAAIGIPRSTLGELVQKGEIRRHSNSIKPLLTDLNKVARLRFCLEMLKPESAIFQDMFDVVHIDEKWFYLTRTNQRYYLTPEESNPYRTCKSKRFIEKVMFLAAVARPRWDPHRKTYFDGKLGIWPFVIKEPAKRSSRNRPKGTPVTKSINVDKQVFRDMLLTNVLPAIRQQWPRSSSTKPIYLQQDNAKPHISPSDPQFVAAASSDGFDIRLRCQPSNSPDMNVLDLGFFNAIQALQHQTGANSIDQLIAAVESSFNELSHETLNKVFLTLQTCLEATMRCGGSNDYKIPHIGKDRLMLSGELPVAIGVNPDLIRSTQMLVQQ